MGSKKKSSKEKPLEKMTATELRDVAKDIPEITGSHGMNKGELLAAIKKSKGITETSGKKKNSSLREIKSKIKALKKERQSAISDENTKMAKILRRRIIRLKKKTRRLA